MTDMDISQIREGDLDGATTDYSVDPINTDGATDQKETEYINTDWSQQLGYYKTIPELRAAIDAIGKWTLGKGYKTTPLTKIKLFLINGFGRDTFNSILENMIRTYYIGGDAFAEIIRNKIGLLINIKPLDPNSIKIIVDEKGILKKYIQVSKTKGKKTETEFQPEDIFHLSRNRIADEIHGISLIQSVEKIILMRNEAMQDMKTLMHRHVKPVHIHYLDTDDNTEIAAYKAKADSATTAGENLYVPMGTTKVELLAVPPNATLNPLPWIDRLNNYFFQAAGVPQIIVGGSQEMTEATAKIVYLSFEQTINEEQLYIQEQALRQLGLKITLEFPASLNNEMLSDKSKSETMQASTQEDTNVQGMPLGGAN